MSYMYQRYLNLEPGVYKHTSGKPIDESSYIDFEINNTGNTEQTININLSGSDLRVYDMFNRSLIGTGSIHLTLDTSNHSNTFCVRVNGEVTSCEYLLTNVTGISVSNMSKLSTIKEIGRPNMQQSTSITYFELMDKSSMTNLQDFFKDNKVLTRVVMNTSDSTNFSNMFMGCSGIISLPQIDTSKGTNLQGMVSSCTKLKTIPQLDISSSTNMNNFLQGSPNVTSCNLIGLKDSLDLSMCSGMTYDSISYILDNSLQVTGKTLNIDGCDGYDSLMKTDPSVVSAVNKGWAITPELTALSIIQGATPPLSVSTRWTSMRVCGSISVSDDHFLIRTDGTCDWAKCYYTLPSAITKIRITCDVNVDDLNTSANANLWISLDKVYNDYFKIYSSSTQSGYVTITKDITLTTPYIGFLIRGTNYTAGEVIAFDIRNLVIEKL